jgi:glutamate synthase domain-containing protein 2
MDDRLHSGLCPTCVTTKNPQRYRALVPENKATRVFNFHQNTLHALQEMLGVAELEHIIRRASSTDVRSLASL